MYLTNYSERALLNSFLGISWNAPTKVYLGLFLSSPTESGQGGVEVAYTGYDRQTIDFTEPKVSGKIVSTNNLNHISFLKASKEVGTITHAGIFDSQAGGNMLAYAPLTESMSIGTDEAPTILSGELSLSFSQNFSAEYKKKILNIFRSRSIAGFIPHMALFNGDPDSGGAEITGDLYERQMLSFTTPIEGQTGYSEISLNTKVTFSKPPIEWGLMDHLVIYDAAINGNPVMIKRRPNQITLKKGHTIILESGSVKISVN